MLEYFSHNYVAIQPFYPRLEIDEAGASESRQQLLTMGKDVVLNDSDFIKQYWKEHRNYDVTNLGKEESFNLFSFLTPHRRETVLSDIFLINDAAVEELSGQESVSDRITIEEFTGDQPVHYTKWFGPSLYHKSLNTVPFTVHDFVDTQWKIFLLPFNFYPYQSDHFLLNNFGSPVEPAFASFANRASTDQLPYQTWNVPGPEDWNLLETPWTRIWQQYKIPVYVNVARNTLGVYFNSYRFFF